jgi:hypothetical protein
MRFVVMSLGITCSGLKPQQTFCPVQLYQQYRRLLVSGTAHPKFQSLHTQAPINR